MSAGVRNNKENPHTSYLHSNMRIAAMQCWFARIYRNIQSISKLLYHLLCHSVCVGVG